MLNSTICLFLIFKDLFLVYVYECFAFIYGYTVHMPLVLEKARRGHLRTGVTDTLAIMWVLELKPLSSPIATTLFFNFF